MRGHPIVYRQMILPDALEEFTLDAQSNLLYRTNPGFARAFCLRTREIVGIKVRQISSCRVKAAAEADVALSVVAPAERFRCEPKRCEKCLPAHAGSVSGTGIGEDRSARRGVKPTAYRSTPRRHSDVWRDETYQDAFFTPGIWPL